MLKIVEATVDQMHLVRELFLEYAKSLHFDLEFQGFSDEIKCLPGSYSPPQGCILIASVNDEVSGCVALRPIDKYICEMKRLYVSPHCQGKGIGRALVLELLRKATQLGYRKIRLDTVPSMTSAIHMYQTLGFYPIPAYRENPVAGTSYFEKMLGAVAPE